MNGPQADFRKRGGEARGRGRGCGGRTHEQPPMPYYVSRNPNPGLQTSPPFFPSRFVTREMVEAAVAKAQSDLLSAGDNVSVWMVSQSAALALQLSSWDSLGFRFNDIPYLRDLQFVEGKVNAFIHCFVNVRRMTSVYELGLEICKSEGVEDFGELGLGPLLRHPLVRHYFFIPPDLKEVCSITIDDLMSSLSIFLYKVKSKEFAVEEFLDFLMKKYSVPARENLGVRIQSMGLYIKFIKGVRRTESAALRSIRERDLLTKQPEKQTYPMSDHSNSFSSMFNDYLGETSKEVGWSDIGNIDVLSSKRCCQCCPAQKKKGKKPGGCKCNGSPFLDDLKLIGIKLAMFNHVSSGKLPADNEENPKSYGRAAYEILKIDPSTSNRLILSTNEVNSFIATWKGACQKHSTDEVLSLMLNIYRCSDKQKRKMQRLFFQYPAVALLNMAVRVLKGENLDALAHASDKLSSVYQPSSLYLELAKSGSSSDNDPMSDDKCVENVEKNATLGDIVKQISCYFKIDSIPRRKDMSLERRLVLRDCEGWLKQHFLVERFECLGHGNFYDFLEKHSSVLPSEVNYFFNGIFVHQPSIEIVMSQQQSIVVLSQAARNFSKNSKLTDEHISMLLRKQFPSMALNMTESGSNGSLNLIDSQRLSDVTFSVSFSVGLLGDYCGRTSMFLEEKIPRELPEMTIGRGEFTGILGSVSTEDAVECLLRAPMLTDLQLWSHWDLVFGPSLGPLLDWLIDLGCIKELSCIVTTDARIIRIDHSATIDGFLEALAQGSSFRTAVKLLSLFHVYGGSKSIPVSLLRCYAQCGINAIIKSCVENLQVNAHETFSAHKCTLQGQNMDNSFDDCGSFYCSPSTPTGSTERSIIYKELSLVNRSYTIVSLFILDCLGYVPSEFRSFTAEILVSAFQNFARDAATVILKECRGVNECIMLHEIGLALGIVEWIEDYKQYSSSASVGTFEPSGTQSKIFDRCSTEYNKDLPDISRNTFSEDGEIEEHHDAHTQVIGSHMDSLYGVDKSYAELSCDRSQVIYGSASSGDYRKQDAAVFIETIRREEFGLDSDLETAERNLLKKQHARLGRALHCLSHELYSQDSHFILELVQNADDNSYNQNVEPTLIFILHASRIVVMNNELGFSDKNIRALCDVGNSTKKGSNGGYIGQKGIGFKSVFRITDAPEIHSNGFHVKFDITEGQIGFVLPTIIPPCSIDFYKKKVLHDSDQADSSFWKTCIVLPFKSRLKQGKGIGPIISIFADLHPSLLLFLQRLKCIMFKNMLDDKLVSMRRETLGDGIVTVFHGQEKLNWLVVRKHLHASLVRPDVQTTKIAMAFTLEQSDNADYTPLLDHQPVFAFLPLRKYGLKFIIQGDFVLPSSREEVDEDSAWNQWLLSEMPDLFLSAEKSFCALSCFKENPANAVTCFMSFVPLTGEVHGFFSPLPQMILSKLRLSNCLLLEGPTMEWVPPCRVLRNWNEHLRMFLSDDLLQQHLGLSYLNKDIALTDSLARALGIQEYGPKILIGLLSSICQGNGINGLGLDWLSSWLNALYATLTVDSSGHLTSAHAQMESDFLNNLRKIPFIPLSNGSYCSLTKGPIWFPFSISEGSEGDNVFRNLPGLYAELRTVTSFLFSVESMLVNEENTPDTIIKVLNKIGVQKLSAHNVVKNHIFPSIYDDKTTNKSTDLMIEYLVFIMSHLQSSCFECNTEREGILQELKKRKIVLTNHGYICPATEPIHFGKEFGNAFNINKLVNGMIIKWNEVDTIYLKHPSIQSLPLGLIKWREFFQELGVTDFVQVNQVERICSGLKSMRCYDDASPGELLVNDWESPELISLLSSLSLNNCLEKNRYLLEILDKMWDDLFSTKARCYTILFQEQKQSFQSSFMKCIADFNWVACSMNEEVHYPKDLFYDCESVRSVLGAAAPYAMPQVTSKRFVEDIGFKVTVTLDDAFRVLQIWRNSEAPLASISQMSKFYTFIRDELGKSEGNIIREVKNDMVIFIPLVYNSNFMSISSGVFMLPHQLYWHDPTGCLDQIREAENSHKLKSETEHIQCITLDIVYPELHDFFVAGCGVLENPPFFHYLEILLHLSSFALPSDVALLVFKVFLEWSDDLNSGLVRNEDMLQLKDSLLKSEITVLPTVRDKWVSLHSRFGLICWSDEEKLIDEYRNLNNVNFLYFGELTEIEKEMLCTKVAPFLKTIGIPSLAEVISREAIFYGIADATKEASLINWILPYVQRYLYKLHSDIYCDLKESGFHKLTQLEVVVVEKLFYRNTLQGNSSTNKKRHECRSLLQVNRLYTTPHADTHSMFLELSRFFFNGIPNLQMANFLHIITKELNSTEQKIESFIVDNLNVPKLPDGELIWPLDVSPKLSYDEMLSTPHTSPVWKHQHSKKTNKRPSAKLNWPPANTDVAPSLHSICDAHNTRIPEAKPNKRPSANLKWLPANTVSAPSLHSICDAHNTRIPEAKPNKRPSANLKWLPANTDAAPSLNSICDAQNTRMIPEAKTGIIIIPTYVSESIGDEGLKHAEILPTSVTELHDETYVSEFTERNRLLLDDVPEESSQSYTTGRLGEMVAYQYLMKMFGQTCVKWVNEKSEMGLPYDLIIEEELNTRFVEVKATTSASKDWFSISTNEWKCALEKGELYSIVRVVLSNRDDAQIHFLNNPLMLCQQKLLQLALLLPKGS